MRLTSPSVLTLITVVMAQVKAQQKTIVTGVLTGINEETGVVPARSNIVDMYEESGPAWYV